MKTLAALAAVALTAPAGYCAFEPLDGDIATEWEEGLGYVFPVVEGFPLADLDPAADVTEVRFGGVAVSYDTLDVCLIGITPDGPVRIASGRYSGMYNFAKSWARFDGESGLLEVQFEMPGTASWYGGTFSFDAAAGTMVQTGSSSGDPSWDAVARIDSLLPLGELAEARATLYGIFYPHHYFQEEEMYCRFLKASYEEALRLCTEGDSIGAVKAFAYLPEYWRTPEWDGAELTPGEYSETGLESYMTLEEYNSIAAWYRLLRESAID